MSNFQRILDELFFVIEHNEVLLCLICQEKIVVFKEYNIKRHYSTKHASKFDMLNGQLRIDRANSLKENMIGQQSLFKAARQSSEAATKVSFLITEAIAKRGKPLSDGEFVKDCLDIQSTPLNRVTSGPGYFDPINRKI